MLTEREKEIFELIKSNPNIAIAEITETINISVATVNSTLRSLKQKGYIKHSEADATTATEKVEITTQVLSTDVSEGEASAFDISINNVKTGSLTSASYYNLHSIDKKMERSFGSYVTDGTLAYAQKNGGQYETAILRNGSILKTESNVALIKSDSQIPDLGVKWSGTDVYLYSSNEFTTESFAGVEGSEVNLVLGKEASGSTHYESSIPNNVLDGDYDTFWSSPWEIVRGEYPWLMVNLGEEKNISRLKVYDDRSIRI